ncbi:cupin domain-containing protein [Aestuariirhabdus sp. LZHN29]|uniref:cupin domain-containing protein n=1 Tax=Aestuariirhabdus sp. LZHN29 TaxID=3417462 RepID=UPI003CF4E53C
MPLNVKNIVLFNKSNVDAETYKVDGAKLITGNPEQSLWNHYSDPSEQFFSGVWQSEPGCWRIDYSEHEFCQILQGHSIVRDTEGNEVHLRSGDNFVIPAGFSGEWEVIETTKKIYVIYEPNTNQA